MEYEAQLKRGALVNLVGLAAKLVYPLFFLIVTWLFGPEVVGLYFLAVFIAEVAISAVASGYNDATIIYASHAADDEADADALYAVLANGFVVTLVLSGVLVGVTYLGAGPLVESVYPDRPTLVPALHIAAWSLPLTAVGQIGIAATKARMHMEYDAAINGFLRPIALLAFSGLAWFLDAGVPGLMLAHVGTQGILAVGGLWGYTRHFDGRRTLRAMRGLKLNREMLGFAIPQNLNMTFNRYLSRVDVMMLAAFGHSDHALAFYAAGALITSNLREVKLIFSQALGPIVARHHAAGARASLEGALGRVCRWTTTISVPIVLAVVVLRQDLLLIVHPTYTADSTFMAVLLIPPMLSCAYGLAGNCIVFTGHSGWNLVNSIVVAGTNTLLNWLLIPHYGLLGAAGATAMAAALITALQALELRLLEGVAIRWSAVWKPQLGLLLGLGVVAVVWDPTAIGGLGARIGLAVGLVLGFGALMLALGHEEARGLLRRRSSTAS